MDHDHQLEGYLMSEVRPVQLVLQLRVALAASSERRCCCQRHAASRC